jgi:hypothetical protein
MTQRLIATSATPARRLALFGTALSLLAACGGGSSSPSGVQGTDLSGATQSLNVGFVPGVTPSGDASSSGNAVGGNGSGGASSSSPQVASSGVAVGFGAPANAVNIFYSGHSLNERPLPDNVASLASSLGKSSRWNQQNILGSPIRVRTRGNNADGRSFDGYYQGTNRDGANLNVLAELRNPSTLGGQRYDAMVITERHDLPISRDLEDGLRYLRHQHERLIEGNAQANSYLYHAWWSVRDLNNPSPWVTYERQAAPVWQCMAARVNTSLRNEGRSDRVIYLPAGLALAELVDRATRGNVDGITGSSVGATMQRLFRDDVHMTDLGMYYMSLVTYASVFRSAPSGGWAPAGVSAAAAKSLQDVAWSVVTNHYANASEPSLDSCSAYMRNGFCNTYTSFIGIPQYASNCVRNYGTAGNDNPFYFNASTDRASWLPAP